ncbi:MAG: hypothetical protein ACW96M_00210 [Candidatus Thorarchaeota archaeon]|jgi:hypothetical protein
MTTRLDLKTKWQQVLKVTPKHEEDEFIATLCENQWVRILAVRNADTTKDMRIEVEVSLPLETISISPDDLTGPEVRSFVQNLIRHLEYLLRLDDAGLTLGVMARESIYTAYLEFDNNPPDTMFDILLPPSI